MNDLGLEALVGTPDARNTGTGQIGLGSGPLQTAQFASGADGSITLFGTQLPGHCGGFVPHAFVVWPVDDVTTAVVPPNAQSNIVFSFSMEDCMAASIAGPIAWLDPTHWLVVVRGGVARSTVSTGATVVMRPGSSVDGGLPPLKLSWDFKIDAPPDAGVANFAGAAASNGQGHVLLPTPDAGLVVHTFDPSCP
jgi:hypothetical protein